MKDEYAGSADSRVASGFEIEKLRIHETVYYKLPAGKGRICPFDHSELAGKTISVWNREKEKAETFSVLECQKCGRYYLTAAVLKSITHGPLQIIREKIVLDASLSSMGKRMDSDQEKKPGQCRWPGCRDRAFKNGLCWEHLQHDNNVI